TRQERAQRRTGGNDEVESSDRGGYSRRRGCRGWLGLDGAGRRDDAGHPDRAGTAGQGGGVGPRVERRDRSRRAGWSSYPWCTGYGAVRDQRCFDVPAADRGTCPVQPRFPVEAVRGELLHRRTSRASTWFSRPSTSTSTT